MSLPRFGTAGLFGLCHVVVALLSLLTACGEPETSQPAWRIVHRDLPGALICVWGTSSQDVWAVGSNAGDGSGSLILHYDGSAWRRGRHDLTADLWWVFGFDDGPVFMGGSGGTIVRYEGDELEVMSTPGGATVFGIWGSAPDDVWAVGGDPIGGEPGFIWRYDGSSWQPAAAIPEPAPPSYYKVWGRSATEAVIVGAEGVILEYDGAMLHKAASPTTRTLLTVHGSGQRRVAVGGLGSAVILENDGAGWRDHSPDEAAPQLFGVRLAGDEGYAVGTAGSIRRREAGSGSWRPDTPDFHLFSDLHAVWIDSDGGVWAVGGDLLSPPLKNGVLIHKGREAPNNAIIE